MKTIAVKLTPDKYVTENVFQLTDIHQLFINWRKANNVKFPATDPHPTIIKLGKFEDECIGSMAWSVSYTTEYIEKLQKMTKEERKVETKKNYKNSSDYWSKEWKEGNKYLPFYLGYDIKVEIVNKENHCELI